ncbi:iron chaperone [Nonomuraea sp. NPDC059194]|uniref:iron chaperone n=1 Tax=Nonomuraea sp. NPDC059194 TaxID=3346764 RepID=UPI0036B0717D
MTATKTFDGFTTEERAAMKAHAAELKASARRGAKADTEADVLAKIAELEEPDRHLAERIHAIVKTAAPALTAKLWYGMPAYARDGKIVCFFQPAPKFKARYATLGFNDVANLDEGTMWPTAYALTTLTDADEARIAALIQQAAS